MKTDGLKWSNPFYTKKRISLRVRNFESNKLKVNDHDGNPIEIAAVVVWRVVDSAEAAFEVDDYENFVHVQSEAALRNLATQYCYDAHEENQMSLRATPARSPSSSAARSRRGSPRPAWRSSRRASATSPTRRRSPARCCAGSRRSAVIAARQKIVEGAVGMVDMALELLQKKHVVELDNDRKAAMVSNLLVVLCGDHEAQPIVNTGTIYQ